MSANGFDWERYSEDIREKHRVLARVEIQEAKLQAMLAGKLESSGVVWITHKDAASEIGEEARTALRWIRNAGVDIRRPRPKIYECKLSDWRAIRLEKGF